MLEPDVWVKISHLVAILKPFAKYTTLLQAESATLSDFYGYWTTVRIKMRKFGIDDFVGVLMNEMDQRETLLFENPVMLSTIYLDPRFQRALTAEQKEIAIRFLVGLHEKIKTLETRSIHNAELSSDSNESNSIDELTAFLNSIQETPVIDDVNETSTDIRSKLKNFDGTKANLTMPVLQFWEEQKQLEPELYKLVLAVFSVYPTQNSVERAFSVLALTLTSLRTRLSDSTLQNILLIRLNHSLYKQII